MEIPFTITDVPKDIKVVSATDSLLHVQVQDNGFDLIFPSIFGVTQPLDIAFSQLKLLKKSNANSNVYYIDPTTFDNDIIQNYGFNTASFAQQDSLIIYTERLVKKKVAVKIPLQIQLASQVQLSEPIRIQPDSITLFGGIHQLSAIDSISTPPQRFETLQNNINKTIPLKLPSNIKASHTQVQLHIKTEAFTETSLDIPIETPWDSTGNVRVFPAKVKVHFAVPLSVYNKISEKQFALYGDIDSSRQGQLSIHIEKQPDNIRILNIEPQTAEFILVK